jgi:hypothetical protein
MKEAKKDDKRLAMKDLIMLRKLLEKMKKKKSKVKT